MDNYEANLSRLQKIQATAITNNQYDIKNYMDEESSIYKSMRHDRVYNARANGLVDNIIQEEIIDGEGEGEAKSNFNSSLNNISDYLENTNPHVKLR